jgi:hypothetical protein
MEGEDLEDKRERHDWSAEEASPNRVVKGMRWKALAFLIVSP